MEGLRRRAEILGIARKRRAHRVAVLGSIARGEARADSDLDLLVEAAVLGTLLTVAALVTIPALAAARRPAAAILQSETA